ncbi:MAG: tetratricopeptide repeat protein [Bacteroidia bacterium]
MSASDKKARKKEVKASVKNPAVDSSQKKYPLWLWGILALVFVVFFPSLGNDFVNWDDPKYILNNGLIKDLSGKGIKAMCSSFYGGNYHPLTALSNAIEYKLFGLSAKPFHFFNLVLHIANTFLVYRLIRLLSSDMRIALAVCLLFGIHPMHAESVVWISERKDVLYTFFYLLATIKYIQLQEEEKLNMKHYLVMVLLFLCSLLSKSAAVVFPLTLILIDIYKGKKIGISMLLNKIPLFILSVIFGLVALRSQGVDGALSDLSPVFSVADRVWLVSYSLVFYIYKLFLPVNLSAFHAYPEKVNELLPWYYYISPLVIAALALVTLKAKQFRKVLSLGLLLFVVNIILVIQVIPVGQALAAERYSYVPYIGLFFIVAHLFFYLLDSYAANRTAFQAVAAVYILALCAVAFNRNKVWKNGITLWNDVIAKNDKVAFAHYNLGNAYKNEKKFQDAINAYSGAIRVDSMYITAWFNRAHAYADIQKHDEAIADYGKVVSLNPKHQEGFYNRAVSNAVLNRYDAAIADYTQSLELKPDDVGAYYSRGNMKAFKGSFEEAIPDYTKAIELDATYSDAYNNRGNCKLNLNRMQEACDDWQKSLQLGNTKSADMLGRYCK